MGELSIRPYGDDDEKISHLIKGVGWNTRQLKGQLDAIHRLISDENGKVLVAMAGADLAGYISAEFYEWNRLGQIQGLIVNPCQRRKGIGTRLIREIENFMKQQKARGIYVDTPADNRIGRSFYTRLGYQEDCIRSEYYDEGSDGVVYLQIFR